MKAQVAQAVKTALAKETENKQVGFEPERNVLHNSGITSGDSFAIIGKINQGTESIQRIGDKIKPKRLTVRGVVTLDDQTALGVVMPIYVRILIIAQKNIKIATQIGPAFAVNNLLKPAFDPNPEVPFLGYVQDLAYPVNTDLFRVYMDKVVKLVPTGATVGTNPLPQWTARWSYTFKSLPSSLTFSDADGAYCNNFAPFGCIGYAYSDNTGPDTLSTRLLSSTFTHLTFEDA